MPHLLSPRRLTFRGHIEVAALAFARSLFSQTELQARVLALWHTGARLEEFDWGHVLFLPSPQKMRANESPATPLVRNKNRLVSAPLERDEELSQGVWIIENGDWRELRNGQTVDVSQWIDVGVWKVEPTISLGTVPEVPLVVAPVALDLRSVVGVGAPDQKWQTIWERGTHSEPRFSASSFFERLSHLLTPRRDAGQVPIASPASIVWSSLVAVLGALLFCVFAFGNREEVRRFPLVIMVGIALVALAAFGAFVAHALGFSFSRPTPRSQGSSAPPFVVPAGVQAVVTVLITIGLLRIALVNLDRAIALGFVLAIGSVVMRALGLSGRLVGSRAVGVSGAPAPSAKGESWFARWLRGRAQKSSSPGEKTRDDLGDLWRRLMAQAALKSGLFQQLGRAQARYLMRSMEMFERGDLENALRHAIALGGEGSGAWSPPPALGLPNARGDLNLSMFNGPARGSMNFGPEIEEKLRALYRRAFEQLRNKGDWQKAAFVLADLLQNAEEAVDFLQEQGQFELAAKLAEGRDLAPGLVVRAWWLAGNRERAIHIAQLKHAYSDAIMRLERDPKNRDNAANLRLLWGHHLAELGRFAPAVEAVWPVEAGRALAQKWLRLGLEHQASPRLLARALSLEPESWNEWLPHLESLWNNERNEDGSRERELLARELGNQKSNANAALQIAARETARVVMADGARGVGGIEKGEWDNLLSLANDGMLRADSKWPAPKPKPSAFLSSGETLDIRIESDQGTVNALDVVLLENGELLVALGESGARLLSRDGRTKAHFDAPCHKIVRAFDAPRALLLARRDDSTRVVKLDLTTRKTQFWGDVRPSCFADCFDGATWFVGSEGRVRALDVSAQSPTSLWDSGDMNGRVKQLAISRTLLAALVEHVVPTNSFLPSARGAIAGESAFESWRFEVPSLILRARHTPTHFSLPTKPTWSRHLSSFGNQFGIGIDEENEERPLMWAPEKPAYPVEKGALAIDAVRLSTQNDCAMLCWRDASGPVASLLRWQSIKIVARLRFVGASCVWARECDGAWLLWDDRGRVVSWNPTSGHREREWILR